MTDTLQNKRSKRWPDILTIAVCVPLFVIYLKMWIPFSTPWDHSRPNGHDDMAIDVAPTDDAILFNAVGNGRRDLYLLQLRDGVVKRITDTPDYEVTPAFSNDGKLIAYAAGVPGDKADHLFTIKADGSGRKQLTKLDANDTAPAWSPDDSMIAFARDKTYVWGGLASNWSDGGVICVVKADGTGERQLTRDDQNAYTPHFSADGRAVLYSNNTGLYSIPIDATGEATRVGPVVRDVVLSQTGEDIVFVEGKYSNDFELFVSRLDGSQKRQITNCDDGCFHPVFNKKGDRLFFLVEQWPNGHPKSKIRSIMLDGSDQQEVADFSLFDDPMKWNTRRTK